LYKKKVPIPISMGESARSSVADIHWKDSYARTDEGEQVPREIADAIDIRRHQGHDLSLA